MEWFVFLCDSLLDFRKQKFISAVYAKPFCWRTNLNGLGIAFGVRSVDRLFGSLLLLANLQSAPYRQKTLCLVKHFSKLPIFFLLSNLLLS